MGSLYDLYSRNGLDEEGAANTRAIIAVQLADIKVALSLRKGKGKDTDPAPPDELALEQHRDYLLQTAQMLADAMLAHSLETALDTDARMVAQAMRDEEMARMDRELALRLSGEAPIPQENATNIGLEDINQQVTELLRYAEAYSANYTPGANPTLPMGYATSSGTSSDISSGPPSDSPSLNSSTSSLVREGRCCVCFETRYCVSAPCGDTYCHVCLGAIFQNATVDEELFPPRCHKQEIPLFLVQPFMSKEDITRFKQKREEFKTRNRTYCHNTDCGRFIPTAYIDEESDCALCGSCGKMTCVNCKKTYHGIADCPEDKDLTATLQLAAQEGWQRCRECHRLVMKAFGCQRITCKCGYEFCYQCGARWGHCTACGDWDARALDRRAEELALRSNGQTPIVPAKLAGLTKQMRQELRERHECIHDGEWSKTTGWNSIRGSAIQLRCEMCTKIYDEYLWVCQGCKLLACNKCKRNRV